MARAGSAFPMADALGHYFNEIKNHELLTKDQEKMLFRRYRQADDYDSANRLVRAHLRLVVKIARDYYSGMGRYSLSDLIQQGNLGLVQAVNKFDVTKQTKFSYYASFWIKAYIFKYLLDNYSSVKIGKTQAQRKLFFSLRKTKEKLHRKGIPATPEQIAHVVGVKAGEVEEMEKRMGNPDQSLNAPFRSRTKEELVDNIRARNESVEETVAGRQMIRLIRRIVAQFKTRLNRREQEILEKRIIAQDPLTLQRLGDQFGVSRERIRQIEANIIRKLRNYFQTKIPDFQSYLAG